MGERSAFDGQVKAVRQRVAELSQVAEGWPAWQRTLTTEALEALSTGLEELKVVGEELVQQNQELAAARRTLEAERQRYEELFQFAPDGYLVTDGEGVIQEANRAAAILLQAHQDFLVGKSVAAFVTKDMREAVDTQLGQLRSGKTHRVLDWGLQMKPWEGPPFWAEVTVASAHDLAGELIDLLWLVRYITQRKRAEEALEESEERYRAIADNIQDGLTIIEDGTVVYFNDRACEIFGYPRDSYVKLTSLDFAAPEEKKRMQRILEQVKRTGSVPDELAYWIVRKDGTRRCVRNRYSSIPKPDGSVARLVVTTDITENERAEEALRESEARYRAIFETTGTATIIIEDDTMISLANAEFERLSGYSRKELEGKKSWTAFVSEEDLERMQTYHRSRRVDPDAAPRNYEFRFVDRQGGVRDIFVTIAMIPGTKKSVASLLDITERKRAEEALKRRAAQLALLGDIGGKIAAVLDLDSVLDRAARLVQESFGYHHVALFTVDRDGGVLVMRARAGDFAHLFPLDHRLKLGQGIVGWVGQQGEKLLANDVSAEPRYVNLYPDVITTQSELSVPIRVAQEIVGVFDVQSPQLNAFDENDVVAMETLVSQIAAAIESARLYEALRESEARSRIVSELTSDFAYAIRVQPDGALATEWATEAFARISGFTPGELRARGGWTSFIYPEDLPEAHRHLQVHLTGQPDVAEFRIVTKSGDVHWLRHYGRPVWDEAQGRVVRIYGAAQDITEQRRVEQYVLRTERLAAMGHMAAALAREIESPLQAVRSQVESALKSRRKVAEYQESLRFCFQEIERLAGIIERVLGLARSARDVPRSVSTADLVQQALALLDEPLQRAHLQVTTDFPADLPPVVVVPDQIVQVLLNLIINAMEALPEEGGQMHVAANVDGEAAVLTLTNDGPPIPPEHVKHIFDPFFTTKPEGAGLGLYIGQSIVEQHGGRIAVQNLKKGQGVAFTVTLPIVQSAESEAAGETVL
jgi:PAS domain S-box-containing protein